MMQMYCEVNKHAEVVVCDRTKAHSSSWHGNVIFSQLIPHNHARIATLCFYKSAYMPVLISCVHRSEIHITTIFLHWSYQCKQWFQPLCQAMHWTLNQMNFLPKMQSFFLKKTNLIVSELWLSFERFSFFSCCE